MNTNSSHLRQTWRKFYRISRLGKTNPSTLVTLLSTDYARIYLAALMSITERDGYYAALMARPISSANTGRWLVHTRCNRYNAHAGRLPA